MAAKPLLADGYLPRRWSVYVMAAYSPQAPDHLLDLCPAEEFYVAHSDSDPEWTRWMMRLEQRNQLFLWDRELQSSGEEQGQGVLLRLARGWRGHDAGALVMVLTDRGTPKSP